MPTFSFAFTETPRDLRDAYEAWRTARTGMRQWARYFVALYGLTFLAVWPVALVQHWFDQWWKALPSLALGLGISWYFVLKPAMTRRRISRTPARAVTLEISDAGIAGRLAGEEPFNRYWGSFVVLLAGRRGIGLGFRDGVISWVPSRAFADGKARSEFETFVRTKLQKA